MFFSVNRSSSAVASLEVDPIEGVVFVEFKNGYMYEYEDVSRSAIINLLMNKNISLGFWVNANCINGKRTVCLSVSH